MFPLLRCLKMRIPLEGGMALRRLQTHLWTHTGFHAGVEGFEAPQDLSLRTRVCSEMRQHVTGGSTGDSSARRRAKE